MSKWKENFTHFIRDKVYMLLLCLTAVCAYGFKITHGTIGIDDTPYAYYFEEGLAAIVGRWVLFLMNKVVHIAEYAPFLTDLAAVLILMAAVTVWCALLYSVLEDRLPKYGYYFFACIFLSCPLISEVFTYYLHNGIAIGYLCCGISLCCFREGLFRRDVYREKAEHKKADRIRCFLPYVGSLLCLWIAMGCYESFMIVWLVGFLLMLLTERFTGQRRGIFKTLCGGAVIVAAGMVLRSIMIALVIRVFGLEYLQEEAVQRSVTEMVAWMLEPGAFSEFAMVLKRVFVMYGVFAYAYYPITIFVLATAVIFCFVIWRTLRQKDAWILLLTLGSYVASFLLVVIEGKATYYRSAQFLPVICGYGALIAAYAVGGPGSRRKSCGEHESADGENRGWKKVVSCVQKKLPKVCSGVLCIVLGVILWNQCADMNHWFYIDYMKYESAKEVVAQIAYDLESGYDTSKPVVFTGTYEVPKGIIEDAYVGYGTKTFFQIKHITDMVDEHLLEKFYRSYGVWVAQTPALSVIDWGRYAFDDDSELIRFFAMHGHKLNPLLETELYETAEEYSLNLPHFPEEGYIADMGDYIIVHF